MYLPFAFLSGWIVLTVVVLLFALRVSFAQKKDKVILRRAKRSLQKLESKNGRLLQEVMRAKGQKLYRAAEVTLTNLRD